MGGRVRHPSFRKVKETSIRGEFIQKVLVTILGYTPYRADSIFTIATEEALGRGAVDVALGEFSDDMTTYPAVATMRRAPHVAETGQDGDLRFLKITSDVPKEPGRAFLKDAQILS